MRQDIPPTPERYREVVSLLHEILQQLNQLQKDVDRIDRSLRPYGDGYARKSA